MSPTTQQLADELARAMAAELTRAVEQNRALRLALQAFLDCDGIPPTQFRRAHQLALAALHPAPPGFVGTVQR